MTNSCFPSRLVASLVCLLVVAACSDASSSRARYLISTVITADGGTHTRLALFETLAETKPIDFSNALVLPGQHDAWVHANWVFVADAATATVSRYVVRNDELSFDADLNFASEGVSSATFANNQILTRHKAYLANAQGREYIVWNPSTMEITGRVPWPETDFGEGFAPVHSQMDHGGELIGKYFFHGIYAANDARTQFGDHSIIGVYDIETDALVRTIDVPCPMMDVASVAADGLLYVSAWSQLPLSYLAGSTPKSCAARIDIETQTLDADWTFDWSDVTHGHQGSALRVLPDGRGIFARLYTDGVSPPADSAWDLWMLNLTTMATEEVGLVARAGSYEVFPDRESYCLYYDEDDGTLFLAPDRSGGHDSLYTVDGHMARLFAIRP